MADHLKERIVPLNQSVVKAIHETSKDLEFIYRILKMKNIADLKPNKILNVSLKMLLNIENSQSTTSSDILHFVNSLQHIAPETWKNSLAGGVRKTAVEECHTYFEKWGFLVEEKLKVPFTSWEKRKNFEAIFFKNSKRYENELETIRKENETAQVLRDHMVAMQGKGDDSLMKLSSSTDFRSRLPHAANESAAEHLEFIASSSAKGLQDLKFELGIERDRAKWNLNEKWKTLEELVKVVKGTGRCVQWLNNWYSCHRKEKEHQFAELWKEFSDEMETSRALCMHNGKMSKVYEEIMRERKESDVFSKEKKAAIKIQALWRGYNTRRHLKEAVDKENME